MPDLPRRRLSHSLGTGPPAGASRVAMGQPQAGPALASRDLGRILRVYRRINGLSQHKLAELLGFDKTYISMIETGRRTISDVTTRRQIARTLGPPTHVLGVTEADDADFAAMVQFADSTLRLAEIARQAGCAVEAVNELWPLVARLEARAAEGRTERDTPRAARPCPTRTRGVAGNRAPRGTTGGCGGLDEQGAHGRRAARR